MASPFLRLKWEKQINEVGPWFCFTLLSLHHFCWPFCSCAPSLCYRPAKQVKKWNANPDICSSFGRLFAWLPANIWNMLFAFHVTPMSFLHFPYLLWASVYLPFFASDSITFPIQTIWHLSDNCSLTFLENCLRAWSCLLGQHQRHHASRTALADRILMWAPTLGIGRGRDWSVGLYEYISALRQALSEDIHGDEEWRCDIAWNLILDLGWW